MPKGRPKHRTEAELEELAGLKRERFLRLANARLNHALHYIAALGHLANRSTYDFAADDCGKILEALDEARERLALTFDAALSGKDGKAAKQHAYVRLE